jgi:UDP-N-acetylmuramyl pentapeptide phosphotransferase/UDP-N-acetylglucosamine-1-phosphate transferase
VPNARSSHDAPTPRGGGVGIVLATVCGFVALWGTGVIPADLCGALLGGGLAVAVTGFRDDRKPLGAGLRLAVHIGAAAWALAWLGGVPPMQIGASTYDLGIVGNLLGALAIGWTINLFNFMDGSDGLAALMAICGFGAFGMALARAGLRADACFALVAATSVFLAVNLPPARVFMGDGGSIGLGFLAAVFGLAGIHAGIWPAWFPLLVFLPFVADATLTVLRRLARGDHLFEAHRTHYYQRLHRMGPGHRGTLLTYGVLIAGTSTSASFTVAAAPGSGWWVLAAWTAAIGALFAGIDYHWRRRSPEDQ